MSKDRTAEGGALVMGDLVTLEKIREARESFRDKVVHTPLLPFPELSQETGCELRLKCESLQRAGSFKARGAHHFLSRLDPGDRSRGVITYSSGNHAQAVAMAAGAYGARAVVVMPTTAPPVKVDGARRLGAQVVLEGTTSLHRMTRAEALAEAEGLAMVPPFDHPDIIAGQGSVGMEIMEDWPQVELVLVPIGGGGLASGVAAAVKALRPATQVVGVEPEGAASMRAALDAGEPVTLEAIDTIADGLAPVRTGDLTFLHARELLDDVVTVPDASIREATALLLHRRKLVVEYSGAATVAALMAGRVSADGKKVAAILSGGNLDPAAMKAATAEA